MTRKEELGKSEGKGQENKKGKEIKRKIERERKGCEREGVKENNKEEFSQKEVL